VTRDTTARAHGFVFAGLSRRRAVEELKTRYPRSQIVGHHVYVSDADSRDHIYGLTGPGSAIAR
jgi:hypothetical protein